MKKIIFVCSLLFSFMTIHAQQDLAGIWNTGKDETLIEITEDNGVFIGKIHSSNNSEVKIGKQILKDVKLRNGELKGQLYAAKKGKWYDAVLKEKDNQIDVTIKVGFMSKTITWKKE